MFMKETKELNKDVLNRDDASTGELENNKSSIKLKDTNIKQYTKEQLITMVNSTDKNNFDGKYPDATFNRTQAWYTLEHEYHMFYLKGVILPETCSKEEIYQLVSTRRKGISSASPKASKKDAISDSAKHLVPYNMSAESERYSITTSTETRKRFEQYLKDHNVKKGNIQIYYSAALELLIEMLEHDEVEIRPII